ncbi:MAG: Rieske (2Fe-2S) protein [Chitinophagaceae bacterium]|nr:Rieske (2Fe-2S) protein [Chitinophagaceae bacterium]
MKRREFISKGCTACLSVAVLGSLFPSCTTTKYIPGELNNNGLLLNADNFRIQKNGSITYREYVIVKNEDLKFPICVYRFSGTEYSALWMQCAHQGAEVQVMGSYLHCPAHGSEYNNRGQVTNGPAIRDLKTFPVTVNNDQLFIDLRKR